jgi:hypothetical protein
MKRLSDEEERDRQQLQITRRRFFFLGFGAAAAAAARRWPFKDERIIAFQVGPEDIVSQLRQPTRMIFDGEKFDLWIHPTNLIDLDAGGIVTIDDQIVVSSGRVNEFVDTGVWTLNKKTRVFEAPPDLTPKQARTAVLYLGLRRES